jgi:hypothetical protein
LNSYIVSSAMISFLAFFRESRSTGRAAFSIFFAEFCGVFSTLCNVQSSKIKRDISAEFRRFFSRWVAGSHISATCDSGYRRICRNEPAHPTSR